MRVLEEELRVLSPNKIIFITTASLSSEMPQLILLIFSGRVILWIRIAWQVVSRCFIIITAKAKRIEAVLKAMFKFVFAKVAQA